MTAELLAPAGDIESGFAAFEYGADAVYLGLGQFSARAEATNFTPAELNALCGFARTANKKVLVAVNTVIFDSELPALIETLSDVSDAKADGVIVQDWGVARIVKKYFPRLRLHASTQMAAHNKQGVEALRDFGFKRVVLARETSLEEIKAYCKERNSTVDPKRFFDYFDAGGWVDGKGNPVRNWKQKLITWETHSNTGQQVKKQRNTSYDLDQLDYMDLMSLPKP